MNFAKHLNGPNITGLRLHNFLEGKFDLVLLAGLKLGRFFFFKSKVILFLRNSGINK